MARLSDNPDELELEDFVAAHLQSRGVFVETGVTARDPQDILELDIVWTDYRDPKFIRHAVEVKSGKWQLGDLFKFFGWTRYLSLPSGQFACRRLPERLNVDVVKRICDRMDIELLYIDDLHNVTAHFTSLQLPEPPLDWLPGLWRFSYWARRRLMTLLTAAIQHQTCPESAKAAKDYAKLVNDAIFFEPDVRARVALLFEAHQKHLNWP